VAEFCPRLGAKRVVFGEIPRPGGLAITRRQRRHKRDLRRRDEGWAAMRAAIENSSRPAAASRRIREKALGAAQDARVSFKLGWAARTRRGARTRQSRQSRKTERGFSPGLEPDGGRSAGHTRMHAPGDSPQRGTARKDGGRYGAGGTRGQGW